MDKILEIKENYPLKSLTTFGVGGPARYLVEVMSEEDLVKAISFSHAHQLSILIIGRGSNLLINDDGFNGLVVLNKIKGMESRSEDNHVFLTVYSGDDWDGFVKYCVQNNLQGIENMSGIPGTVGASPVQNIGAYGQNADSVITEVRAMDVQSGKPHAFKASECGFGYRKSIFNTNAYGRYIITAVTFRLTLNGLPDISYRDLRNYFPDIKGVALPDVREAVLDIRDKKGLLLMDGREGFKCAGSFFKNPVISPADIDLVKDEVEQSGNCENWTWQMPSGEVKVSAACLMQCAGFGRGYRSGNVGISPKHALCLINYGDATASEVFNFSETIRQKVQDKFGILLVPEVRLSGFDSDNA